MKDIKVLITLVLVMLTWGINVSALKYLVTYFDPITMTSMRIMSAAVPVFVILFFLKKIRLPRNREWLYIVGGAATNVVMHHYFLAEGLSRTSAANGGLILGLGPLLTATLAVFILKEKVTGVRALGFLFGGIGVSIVVLGGSGKVGELSFGDVEIFLSILSQAISFMLIKKASSTMDARLLTGYMLLIGSIILVIIALIKEPGGFAELSKGTPTVWGVFLFSALIATAVGHMAYNSAIQTIGAARASIFLNFNTFFALIGASIFLGESIYPAHFIGLVFIVAGVLFGSGSLEMFIRNRNKPVPPVG
ncbi:EamA family transporter [Sporosarcina sp. P21c]|uniref:DMT family transporter n=1 Tax=Sporosarcina sp. P21c TaxID=2048255 RepID=UPI000C164013|nr:DMT family transporter [Sporosarcina sp. P21c]PIC89112.1 EamA family transporter [Sporosarcina sp. P21c]